MLRKKLDDDPTIEVGQISSTEKQVAEVDPATDEPVPATGTDPATDPAVLDPATADNGAAAVVVVPLQQDVVEHPSLASIGNDETNDSSTTPSNKKNPAVHGSAEKRGGKPEDDNLLSVACLAHLALTLVVVVILLPGMAVAVVIQFVTCFEIPFESAMYGVFYGFGGLIALATFPVWLPLLFCCVFCELPGAKKFVQTKEKNNKPASVTEQKIAIGKELLKVEQAVLGSTEVVGQAVAATTDDKPAASQLPSSSMSDPTAVPARFSEGFEKPPQIAATAPTPSMSNPIAFGVYANKMRKQAGAGIQAGFKRSSSVVYANVD
ncbi:unnamed protein product [Amoebophrya sp. A120]|nr:unnamed protein product [Amoebophrya sp. A120]|eukprot:GSA120T00009330001.1